MTTTKTCTGWSRYNSGQHSPCDRPATGPDGYCDLHLHVARSTDPYGVKG